MTHRITNAIAATLYSARLYLVRTRRASSGQDAYSDACTILFECEACILLEDSQN
jgi:hypothetical protein